MMRPVLLASAVALLVGLAACGSGGGGGADDGDDPSSTCGNSQLDGDETCDDGQAAPVGGDGCSDQCQVEAGWLCAVPGEPCVADRCGDGIRAGVEDCDLGDANNGADPTQGCEADCTFAEGWVCDDTGCRTTTCGDGVVEGTEQCDEGDGTNTPFDGCSTTCKIEPNCSAGMCSATCGDGIVMAPETCDDGNTNSGDGCSADCLEEQGFSCTLEEQELPEYIDADVIYRDFKGMTDTLPDTDNRHPDFQEFACGQETQGLVEPGLTAGNNYTPAFLTTTPPGAPCGAQLTSEERFADWYADAPDYNKTIITTLRLTRDASSEYYVFDSLANGCADPVSGCFFPLDDNPDAWGNTTPDGADYWPNNFHFTTETRYWFTYQGNETLSFTGDDDVWVFINNTLAVDLGGLHSARSATLSLLDGDGSTQYAAHTEDYSLGLVIGGVYEMSFFHAERHTHQSNFKLTLGNFVKAKSICVTDCGDGYKTPMEECDLGDQNGVTGSGCTNDCKYEGHGMSG